MRNSRFEVDELMAERILAAGSPFTWYRKRV